MRSRKQITLFNSDGVYSYKFLRIASTDTYDTQNNFTAVDRHREKSRVHAAVAHAQNKMSVDMRNKVSNAVSRLGVS